MSYNLENIFQYSVNDMNTYLRNQHDDPNKYPSIKEKRYMTVYYLSKNGYLEEDPYTRDPKFGEYLLESETWDDYIYNCGEEKYNFLRACANGDINLVKQYLEKYGNKILLFRDNYGKTPLMLASSKGHTEIVKLLLATGESHPEYLDNDGMTVLMLTCGRKNHFGIKESIDIVKLLLATGESHPELQDKDGYTALMYASLNCHTEIVELLVNNGQIHIDHRDKSGMTALMIASFEGCIDIVNFLLSTGQSHPEYKDYSGRTALDHAKLLRFSKIVKSIEEYKPFEFKSAVKRK